MIITRTGEAVEFQLTETRRVAIDVSCVASASKTVERTADGRLENALLLMMDRGDVPVRVEASAAQVTMMHDRLAEIMSETTDPRLSSATPSGTDPGAAFDDHSNTRAGQPIELAGI